MNKNCHIRRKRNPLEGLIFECGLTWDLDNPTCRPSFSLPFGSAGPIFRGASPPGPQVASVLRYNRRGGQCSLGPLSKLHWAWLDCVLFPKLMAGASIWGQLCHFPHAPHWLGAGVSIWGRVNRTPNNNPGWLLEGGGLVLGRHSRVHCLLALWSLDVDPCLPYLRVHSLFGVPTHSTFCPQNSAERRKDWHIFHRLEGSGVSLRRPRVPLAIPFLEGVFNYIPFPALLRTML